MSIVIYPPTLDWTWMKQRPQQLMTQLARLGYTVFFCNRTRSVPRVERIEPNLFVVHHHEHWLQTAWPKIRKTAPVLVWCSLPFAYLSIAAAYSPDQIVYDCSDELGEWFRAEKQLAVRADAIVCSSQRLYDRIRRCYPEQRAALIRNGYDPSMKLHLLDEEVAASHGSSKRRQIGYVGAWAPWIDEGLIGQCSQLFGAEVTVIGPPFDRRHRPGAYGGKVRFLGLKRHEELRDYIQSFSVCVIPFRITPVTVAANPVKAYEYLAAGKPVISTALPECQGMAPHVDIAESRGDFIRKVAERLDEPGDGAARISYALNHTWERRAREIDAFLRSLPERKERTRSRGSDRILS
ncbi:glycosyltransferase [Paenibacillus oleatilyticus]|uniref:glycosyltransferase n=1 Tax=Paenibacillus oleatilyticus TaxID=2594886 RepID=UPI001C1FA595|nr:glycosyltransferase [Paenibacillus oleatilyticus]MBU7317242.1 glycosyltransferase [Paenibacillus oleatilyticus]